MTNEERLCRVEQALWRLLTELQESDVPGGVSIAAGIAKEDWDELTTALGGDPWPDRPADSVRLDIPYAASWTKPLRELQAKVADLQQILALKDDALSRVARKIEILVREVSPTQAWVGERLWEIVKEAEDA